MQNVAEASGLTKNDILGVESSDVIYNRNLTTLFHVDIISESFDNYNYWEENFDD